jgi:NAD(P)-dependent dehydrogenase (short-subunit alcohol dehydrogenase family)
MPELSGKKAVVVGASRGLGLGIAGSLSVAGASVYAIARGRAGLDELTAWDPSIEVAVADATDPNRPPHEPTGRGRRPSQPLTRRRDGTHHPYSIHQETS